MRLTSLLLLVTVTTLSVSSCTLFRGGENTDRTEPEDQASSVVESLTNVVDEPAEDQPVDVTPPEKELPPQLTTLYSTASLNVRSGRGTSYSVVAGLSYGDPVAAGRLEDDWYELFSDGQSIGFAHSSYLSAEKPALRMSDGVPSASLETGLFGVSLPVGASLVESTPLKLDSDAMESYRVPMANEEIRAFYVHELASLGWKSDTALTETGGVSTAETGTTLNYRKGDLVLTVVLDVNGQRFTLTGGQR